MRQAVAHVKATFGVSERRACSIIKADRKSVRYRSCRPPDTALRERLRALAVERRRFGYRRKNGVRFTYPVSMIDLALAGRCAGRTPAKRWVLASTIARKASRP